MVAGGGRHVSAQHAIPGNRWDLLAGEHADPASVTVIVAHYEQPEQLARTLRALRHQDHPAELVQIVVVDDGSAAAPAVPAGVTLLRQENRGFRLAAARNLGASAAQGDVLIFLDADTTPERGYVSELTRLPALAPDCVTVGLRRHAALTGTRLTDDVREAARGRELPGPAWLRDAYRRSRDLLIADDRSYRFVIGAVLACSRRFFDETGGFDESFDAYGGEDWEWAYRAWLAGAVFAHVPTAVAWHDGADYAGREPAARGSANAEAMRLAQLIPIPGSRPRGLPTAKADVAVVGPPSDSAAQIFVALDSALAQLPGGEQVPATGGSERFDRVRVLVEILVPVRVHGDALARAVERVSRDQLGALELTDRDGIPLVRIASTRAQARARRWGCHDLFESVRVVEEGLTVLTTEPDVEAYLGGWG